MLFAYNLKKECKNFKVTVKKRRHKSAAEKCQNSVDENLISGENLFVREIILVGMWLEFGQNRGEWTMTEFLAQKSLEQKIELWVSQC